MDKKKVQKRLREFAEELKDTYGVRHAILVVGEEEPEGKESVTYVYMNPEEYDVNSRPKTIWGLNHHLDRLIYLTSKHRKGFKE